VFFTLAVLCHVGSCYAFATTDFYGRGSGGLASASWVLLLVLAVIFWVLRARVRNHPE
jgi:hypothetical protein